MIHEEREALLCISTSSTDLKDLASAHHTEHCSQDFLKYTTFSCSTILRGYTCYMSLLHGSF